MSTVYLRPELAEQMASQLLNPGVLDEGLRSGLFLFGMRRTGKTTYSADAAAGYASRLGREVKVEEIQPVLNVMVAENLVMRTGHGVYSVPDPFVQEIWRERQDLLW